MAPTGVIVAGATGKVGRLVCAAVLAEPQLALVGAVGRRGVGRDLGELLGRGAPLGVPLRASLAEALADGPGAAVLVDFSSAALARESVPLAIAKGLAPVVGTTGFSPRELQAWAEACRQQGVGAAFVANFSIGAYLMMKWAVEARRFFPDAEIIELHHQTKLDAPSGTALRTQALLEGAGGNLGAARVPIHSIRLPGLVAHQEVLFGGAGEVLTIRHDTLSREAFVPGVLAAIRYVTQERRIAFDLADLW